MIQRYSRKEMAAVWSDLSKWEIWLKIELLASEALVLEGKIPQKALLKIKKRAKIYPRRIEKIEKEVRHDVIAFVSAVAESVGKEGRYLHMGLTSSDILDTAFACQLVRGSQLLEKGLKNLLQVLKLLSKRYEKTPMMGRSHGIHAEPITFGLKIATWYAEIKRQLSRLDWAKETIAVGKISGAVGTYAHVSPRVEEYVLKRLNLKGELPATQVVSRDRHAFYFGVLAGIASSIEKIAVEIRHLARTEIQEVAEPFDKNQKGSSAMPHKKNPVLTENVTGLARLIRSYAQAAYENVSLWHERDISHSSVERVIAPDALILLDFMIHRMTLVLKGLRVYPERMRQNMEATHGAVFSQEVLLSLVEAGMSREKAYGIVQRLALEAMKNGDDFQVRVAKDPAIRKHLKPLEIKNVFDWERKLGGIGRIISRTLKIKGAQK